MRDNDGARGDVMGLVKTRRLAAMQKQQRAKAGMRPPCKDRKNRCARHAEKEKLSFYGSTQRQHYAQECRKGQT